MTFPAPVPEIPAGQRRQSRSLLCQHAGLHLRLGVRQRRHCRHLKGNYRLFITNRSFRESYGNIGPILFWLNLVSKTEVDELFAQWKAAQAKIVSEHEDRKSTR